MINTAVKLQRSTGTMICGRNGGLQLAYVLARHLDMKSHLCLNSLVSVVLDDHLWHAADESHAHLRRVVGAEWRERAAAAVHLGREQVVQLRLMVRTLKTRHVVSAWAELKSAGLYY